MVKHNFIQFSILLLMMFSVLTTGGFKGDLETAAVEFKFYSPAFDDGKFIPSKYTCDGINVSPPLRWTNAPGGAKSLALICNDPDAPIGDWVHWIVYNIPPTSVEIKEGASSKKILPKGAFEGLNDFGKNNYGGPCPPSGTHRYFFKLYALDVLLPVNDDLTKKQLLRLMKEHLLAEAVLIGKYQRK